MRTLQKMTLQRREGSDPSDPWHIRPSCWPRGRKHTGRAGQYLPKFNGEEVQNLMEANDTGWVRWNRGSKIMSSVD